MAWTTPTTRSTSDSISPSIWNTDVIENLVFLRNPPTFISTVDRGSNYTTASTSFVDIDTVLLGTTLTTYGGDIIISFQGGFNASTLLNVYLDVTTDGTRIGGDDGIVFLDEIDNFGPYARSLAVWKTGLSSGSHSFVLQWKVNTGTATLFAGAGSSQKDLHPHFIVSEMT